MPTSAPTAWPSRPALFAYGGYDCPSYHRSYRLAGAQLLLIGAAEDIVVAPQEQAGRLRAMGAGRVLDATDFVDEASSADPSDDLPPVDPDDVALLLYEQHRGGRAEANHAATPAPGRLRRSFRAGRQCIA